MGGLSTRDGCKDDTDVDNMELEQPLCTRY